MDRRKIDIPLDGVGQTRRRSVHVPLAGETEAAITDQVLAAVNRHHEAYKEMRRRAQ